MVVDRQAKKAIESGSDLQRLCRDRNRIRWTNGRDTGLRVDDSGNIREGATGRVIGRASSRLVYTAHGAYRGSLGPSRGRRS